MKQHQILVSGGGVIGAALTLGLHRRGFDAVLVERAPPIAFKPETYDARVYAMSKASADFLEGLGVWSDVTASRASAYTDMRVWQDDFAQELHFCAHDAGTPQLGWVVENSLLLDRLWNALPATAKLREGSNVEAPLTVSAEGADSALREVAGIESVSVRYEQRAVVCHVATGKPHQSTAWQRFLPSGPLAFLPLADGRSSIVWSADEPLAEELLSLGDTEFRERLAQASQRRFGEIGEVTARLSFPLRMQHAEHYVREGFALVGDSAHVIHPLAGQGVNLGLADAAALIKVLSDARDKQQSVSSLRVLQRYERARRAANTEAIALTDSLYRLFGLNLPAATRMRELGLGAVSRIAPLKRELARRAMGI